MNILFDKAWINKVFVTSDPHYGHAGICRGTSCWAEETIDPNHCGTRNFDTLEEMNDALVDGINKTVGKNDVLICLGDWSFGGIDNIWEFRKRIECDNIYLVYGNHDHHIKRNKLLPNINKAAQSLFKYCGDVLDFKVKLTKKSKARPWFASHYSHRVWDKSHHGKFHIFGHSHGSLDHLEHGKSMDVGVDCAFKLFGEYRPFAIEEVEEILQQREIKFIDHHNPKTN